MNKFIKWSNNNQGLIGILSLIAGFLLVVFGALLVAGLVISLFIIFFFISRKKGAYQEQKNHINVHSPNELCKTKPIPKHLKKRRVINVTPEYLSGIYEDNMSIHAKKLTDDFIGKWMKVSGPLGDVGAFNGFSQVTFLNRGLIEGGKVYMLFRDRDYVEDKLSVLKKGDKITVVGQIDRIDIDVQLDNCELVDK